MNLTNNETLGRIGEDRVFDILKAVPGIRIFRNLYIPTNSGRTVEIDLLALSAKVRLPL